MTNPNEEKKIQIGNMFSRIAGRYDLANDLLSFGLHRLWKRKSIAALDLKKKERLLDLCCGTGDLLSENPDGIGADLSYNMLHQAKDRVANPLVCADGENLPFKEKSFQKAIIGFGIRNIPNVSQGLTELFRVLAPQGRLVVLEFSKPKVPVFSNIYFFFLTRLLPVVGGWISKDKEAYEYLARTICSFPDGRDFLKLMENAGFRNTSEKRLSLGIATIYCGDKS